MRATAIGDFLTSRSISTTFASSTRNMVLDRKTGGRWNWDRILPRDTTPQGSADSGLRLVDHAAQRHSRQREHHFAVAVERVGHASAARSRQHHRVQSRDRRAARTSCEWQRLPARSPSSTTCTRPSRSETAGSERRALDHRRDVAAHDRRADAAARGARHRYKGQDASSSMTRRTSTAMSRGARGLAARGSGRYNITTTISGYGCTPTRSRRTICSGSIRRFLRTEQASSTSRSTGSAR